MLNALLGLLRPLFSTANDVARNRLINKHTSKGIGLLVVVGVAFGGLNEVQANLIMNLLSGMHIGYVDIWILGINGALFYMGFRAVKLIARASDCLFEEKILKKHNNNDNDNKNNMNFTSFR